MNDKVKELNDGAYNNILVVVLALAGVYLLISGFNKSKKEVYLDNAGTDPNIQLAQGLRTSFQPWGGSFFGIDGGTDVDGVMSIATQIKDYKAVSDAYRVLYGSELSNDLQKELNRDDLQRFWDLVYKRTGSTTTTPGGSTTTTSSVSKKVTANQVANIRQDKAPYDVEIDGLGRNKQTKKGEFLGYYISERVLPDIPNKGNKNVFVKYNQPITFPLTGTVLYYVSHFVLKSAVTIK